MKRLDLLLGTLFGAGLSPRAPGTLGSLVALGMISFIPDPWYGPVVGALALLSIPLGIKVAKSFIAHRGKSDPQDFVLDEGSGLWIACWRPMAPHWSGLILGFLLFRLFDITKPGPVGRAERLPGARGVVYDDVVAGFFALPLSWLLELLVIRAL